MGYRRALQRPRALALAERPPCRRHEHVQRQDGRYAARPHHGNVRLLAVGGEPAQCLEPVYVLNGLAEDVAASAAGIRGSATIRWPSSGSIGCSSGSSSSDATRPSLASGSGTANGARRAGWNQDRRRRVIRPSPRSAWRGAIRGAKWSQSGLAEPSEEADSGTLQGEVAQCGRDRGTHNPSIVGAARVPARSRATACRFEPSRLLVALRAG